MPGLERGLCWAVCATYGLGRGPYPTEGQLELDLPPLDERVNRERISQWMDDQGNTAKITGRNKRNLNPLIREIDQERHLEFAWWWLHVGGKPAEFSAFNSRDDKLASRWKTGFQARALLPATWYVEKGRTCGLSGTVFGIAAITTSVKQHDGTLLTTYSMVTRDAVAAAETVHPRMPLILPPEFHDQWLDTNRPGDLDFAKEAVQAAEDISHQVQVEPQPGSSVQTEPLF